MFQFEMLIVFFIIESIITLPETPTFLFRNDVLKNKYSELFYFLFNFNKKKLINYFLIDSKSFLKI